MYSSYSSSRLGTLCLFRFAFPLEQELLGRKVVQGLVRSHAVVDLLPVSKLVVQRGQAWFLVGQFVEFLVMRAIRALHMAVQFWGPWQQNEQGNLFLLAGLLELCGEFTSAIHLQGGDREGHALGEHLKEACRRQRSRAMMRLYNVPPGNHISCAEVFQNYAWPPPCTAPGAAQTAQASLQ
jgi:hypothetical protein